MTYQPLRDPTEKPQQTPQPVNLPMEIAPRRRKRSHRSASGSSRNGGKAFEYSRDRRGGAGIPARDKPFSDVRRASNVMFAFVAVLFMAAVLIWAAYHYGKRQSAPKMQAASTPVDAEVEVAPTYAVKRKALTMVREGIEAMKRGKYEEAAGLLQEAKDTDPRLPGIYLILARLALRKGDVAGADSLLVKSISLGDSVVECLNLRGSLLVRQRAFREAYAAFEEAYEREPLNAYPYFYWGDALRADGKPAQAIEKFSLAESLATEQSDLFLIRVKLLLSQVEAEHDAEFWSVIEESIAKSPESGEWRLAAAAWQLKHGNYEEAAVRLKAAEEALQPVFYRFLIEDAFFDFYRDRPEVRDLLGRKTKES